jgi:hypothetical protein
MSRDGRLGRELCAPSPGGPAVHGNNPFTHREQEGARSRGDRSWETLVPPRIVQIIRQNKLFGYQPPSER